MTSILLYILTVVIPILIIIVVGHKGVNALESHLRKQSEIKARTTLELADRAGRDEEGFLKVYDPHFTRDLEEKEGIAGKKTQCDDTNCPRCYWKARYRKNLPKVYGSESILQGKERDYVDSLVDGLSDELYDSLLEDYREENKQAQEDARKADEANRAATLAEREKAKLEKLYATPLPMIEKYKAEGRVYDKNTNTWSGPNRSRARDWEASEFHGSSQPDINADVYKHIEDARDYDVFHIKDDRGNTYVARGKAQAKARVDRMLHEQKVIHWLEEHQELMERINRMDLATKDFATKMKSLEAGKSHSAKNHRTKQVWNGAFSEYDWEDGDW